jgi:hypothetical protein
MSNFITAEMRFAGSLTPTSDGSTIVTFNAAGEQVTIQQNTTWTVVFFQAHSHSAGAAAAQATLLNLTSGAVYARIEMTGQGSFAIENQGREISPLIRPSNGSETLTCRVNSGSASHTFSCGANLEQVYGDPVA